MPETNSNVIPDTTPGAPADTTPIAGEDTTVISGADASARPKKVALSGNVNKIADISIRATEAGAVPRAQTLRVFDVPVVVDQSKCLTGCKLCVDSCPVDCLAIHPDYKKSYMKFDECWYCLACEVDCPTNAITVKMPFLLK